MTTPIVYVHFPKAGGSSLTKQLKDKFGDRCLADYNHDPLGPQGDETRTCLPVGTDAVHGHFKAARYDQISGRFLFTFLRDPIENLLSIFCFWQQFPPHGNPWHDRFLEEKPDIVSFAHYAPLKKLASEVYFGGFDLKQFDFIGFHERRHDSVFTLNRMTGLGLSAAVHENKTDAGHEFRAEVRSTPKIMGQLRPALQCDIDLYDRARSLFAN